jgi:hypothetical protein
LDTEEAKIKSEIENLLEKLKPKISILFIATILASGR